MEYRVWTAEQFKSVRMSSKIFFGLVLPCSRAHFAMECSEENEEIQEFFMHDLLFSSQENFVCS